MNAHSAYVIPYELFDDGTADCKNFWLADDEDLVMISFASIRNRFPMLVVPVLNAIEDGKMFLDIQQLTNGLYREIQWD